MSEFFSSRFGCLIPYTPGEQPKDRKFIKLNTNESPFPPSPLALRMAREAAGDLQLYSDPECTLLCEAGADFFGIEKEQIIFGNGSDELLAWAFMAFCDDDRPAVFADITYGFYKVFAEMASVPYEEIALKEDFSIDIEDYMGGKKTVFLANPNAPTALMLPLSDIERLAAENPGNLLVVDEAYVDFGAESAVPLINRYKNILVVQTFSKSRSLAGGRLGMAMGSKELIRDLNTVKYSFNPYNVNRMTMAAGIGALRDEGYFRENCRKIMQNRQWTMEELKKSGFELLDSKTNFIWAWHPDISGKELYTKLREAGVLVRYFDKERLDAGVRISVGDAEQMKIFIEEVKRIVKS